MISFCLYKSVTFVTVFGTLGPNIDRSLRSVRDLELWGSSLEKARKALAHYR